MQGAKVLYALILALFLIGAAPSSTSAAEILFRNQQGPQTGVVVATDEHNVTISFPREAIESITGATSTSNPSASGLVIREEDGDYLVLKIPRRLIRTMPPEGRFGTLTRPETDEAQPGPGVEGKTVNPGEKVIADRPTSSPNLRQLLQEEMGHVQGKISWRGKPLSNRKVKIVLERYSGFSPAALKKWSSRNAQPSPNEKIILETETDERGQYVFQSVPPGSYRLYWLPDAKTGWIRRLREKPDFEVSTGSLTVANVPENHGEMRKRIEMP